MDRADIHLGRVRDPLAEPVRHLLFAKLASGQGDHRFNHIERCEAELPSVEGNEKAGEDPGGPFVSIDERMVACDAERISRREGRNVPFAIGPLVDRPS